MKEERTLGHQLLIPRHSRQALVIKQNFVFSPERDYLHTVYMGYEARLELTLSLVYEKEYD